MKLKLPPTAVDIILAEQLQGEELAAYFQLNFIEFGALVVDMTDNNKQAIESFVELIIESFNRGVKQYSEERLDVKDNGKLASILTTPSGELQ